MVTSLATPTFRGFCSGVSKVSVPRPFYRDFIPFTVMVGGLLSGVPKFSGLGVSSRKLGGGFNLVNRPLFLNVMVNYNVNTLNYKD